jgi:hypothetical protein
VIIGANGTFQVGYRGVGLIDKDYVAHNDQPFVVLRAATVDEYIAEYREDGRTFTPDEERHLREQAKICAWFYEVSVD